MNICSGRERVDVAIRCERGKSETENAGVTRIMTRGLGRREIEGKSGGRAQGMIKEMSEGMNGPDSSNSSTNKELPRNRIEPISSEWLQSPSIGSKCL